MAGCPNAQIVSFWAVAFVDCDGRGPFSGEPGSLWETGKQLGFNGWQGGFDLLFSEAFYDSEGSAIELSVAGHCLPCGL